MPHPDSVPEPRTQLTDADMRAFELWGRGETEIHSLNDALTHGTDQAGIVSPRAAELMQRWMDRPKPPTDEEASRTLPDGPAKQ